MLRLLIACGTDVLAKEVAHQFRGEYLVESCGSGQKTLELMHTFEPDIILIDMALSGIDSITVIRTIRGTGKRIGILAISAILEDYIINQLAMLNVDFVLPKPCTINAIVSHIRDIGFCLQYPNNRDWCVDNEVENILLSLGFRIGPERYYHTKQAILLKYRATEYLLMKWVYLEVARKNGGNSAQVEKAIRDAIKAAWSIGNACVWKMYFPNSIECPTNEEFVSRIANSLIQRARVKPPYEKEEIFAE